MERGARSWSREEHDEVWMRTDLSVDDFLAHLSVICSVNIRDDQRSRTELLPNAANAPEKEDKA